MIKVRHAMRYLGLTEREMADCVVWGFIRLYRRKSYLVCDKMDVRIFAASFGGRDR